MPDTRLTWPRLDTITWSTLVRDLGAALVVSLAALTFYMSAASLMFQGALAVHVPAAVGAALLGGGLLALMLAWRGAMPLASAGAVSSTVPVLATITAAIASSAPPQAALPTAVVALSLSAAAMGAAWWLMGRRGWGDLIRFVPYPVIGGFMGATGWLLVTGGLGVSVAEGFTWTRVAQWGASLGDGRLAACVAVGGLLWGVGKRSTHAMTLPALLLLSAAAVHGGLALAGLDRAAALAAGWLIAPFQQALPVWPLQPAVLAGAQWSLVLDQAGLIAACVIVGTLSMLLTETSLEALWETRADINRDLRALGRGNLLAAAVGGLGGGLSLSRSTMNHAAGAQGRASGVLLGALCLLALPWGGLVLALIPLPVLGGLLLAQGLDMLKTWLIDSRARLAGRDHAIVAIMVATAAVGGLLPAVCLGVLVCCVDFAVSQAQQAPVRRLLTRAGWFSAVERPAAQADWLAQQGARLQIVELQGVLFFGSATRLSRQIEAVLDAPLPPRRLVFDFQNVRSVDSSAAQSLARLFKAAHVRGTEVDLCGLGAPHAQALRTAGALTDTTPPCHADIDAAVAAWDDTLLVAPDTTRPDVRGLQAVLSRQVGAEMAERVEQALDRVPLPAGQTLFRRGEPSDALYLVASGRLAILVTDGMREVTVRTLLPGSTLGEMGLFRGEPRAATAVAAQDTEVLRLTRERLTALQADDPPLAAALMRVFVLQMVSRVERLTVLAHQLAR